MDSHKRQKNVPGYVFFVILCDPLGFAPSAKISNGQYLDGLKFGSPNNAPFFNTF
jgi:hypothetical protein